jgi:hypothetical protein
MICFQTDAGPENPNMAALENIRIKKTQQWANLSIQRPWLSTIVNDKSKELKGFHSILKKNQEGERQLRSSYQGRLNPRPLGN